MLLRVGYKVTGRLHVIGDTQQITERFQKREFVLEVVDNPRYPQLVQFQLTGDRVSAIDGFDVGQEVELEFSLRGREWTARNGDVKYFNSLDVWKIERAGAQAQRGPGDPPGDDVPLPPEPVEEIPSDDVPSDDIPF